MSNAVQQFRNLTGKDLKLRLDPDTLQHIPAENVVARAERRYERSGVEAPSALPLDIYLPEPEEGVTYIVTPEFLSAMHESGFDTSDLVSPDFSTAVFNTLGAVKSISNFVRK